MSVKQFYFLCFIGVTVLGGLFLLLLWRKVKDKHPDQKGLFFIAIAMLAWATIGLYKIFDPPIPRLLLSDIDRIFSAFTNIFYVAALPYFSFSFKKIKAKWSFFRQPEKWVTGASIFFAFLAALFAVIDRNIESEWGKNTVIAIDSLFSTLTIGCISLALYQSITHIWNDKVTRWFFACFFLLFTSTQLIMPLTAIYPQYLGGLYLPSLVVLLLGLMFVNLITASYFTLSDDLFLLSKSDSTQQSSKAQIEIVALHLGYDSQKKVYFIELTIEDENSKTQHERIESVKLLLPFANWFMFVIAKQLKVKLSNQDIPTTKFRMVEYWNKDAEHKINQEMVFINDASQYELLLDAEQITLSNQSLLQGKIVIIEAIQKHADSFRELLGKETKTKAVAQQVFELLKQEARN